MIAVLSFVTGIILVLWAAERLTDGILGVASSFAVSAFFVSALVSGFEPENLVTGMVANSQGLPQIALGTVIGAAIFMLLGGFGAALLIVPLEIRIPHAGILAMAVSLFPLGWVLLNDGNVSRSEGLLLVLMFGALMAWLYWTSPVLLTARSESEGVLGKGTACPRLRSLLFIVLGIAALMIGAELIVRGARGMIQAFGWTETFFGMTVVAIGESLEETVRMVAPARRGRHDVALGNVVGTTIIFLTLNLVLIALIRPLTADPWVLKFHVPYLIGCVLVVAALLLAAKRLGRWAGATLLLMYLVYLAVNLRYL